MARLAGLVAYAVLGATHAQKAGTSKQEEHPTVTFASCTKTGCVTDSETMLTMDAQWRWLHNAQSGNCIQGDTWAVDASSCSTACSIEGISKSDYQGTYGVTEAQGGVRLKYVNGQSIGSRLYMMEDESNYKLFKLLNKEFTFDVDVSALECGLNGAVYFVEMEANGGLGAGGNAAGAKFGTGYCDAQCPHDLKYIGGQCNIKGWHMTKAGPIGHYGSCCSEMDIWEANAMSTAYTVHPCETLGPMRCEGDRDPNQCGDTPEDCTCCDSPGTCPCCGRYKGVCDRDGCDYNSYRLGNASFFGKGPQFAVDTSKPMTVVTQFITTDNTEQGDLKEIRRLYVQDGKVIKNSVAANVGDGKANSITDDFCRAQKQAFGNQDDFAPKGGLRAMGEALRRGMVLVLSLWDDALTKMSWLDSVTPETKPASTPGVKRGTCAASAGNPSELRAQHPEASVTYSNIRVGDIGTTYGAAAQPAASTAAAAPPLAPVPGSLAAPAAQGFVPVTQVAGPAAQAPFLAPPQAASPPPLATPPFGAVGQGAVPGAMVPPPTLLPPGLPPQGLPPAAQGAARPMASALNAFGPVAAPGALPNTVGAFAQAARIGVPPPAAVAAPLPPATAASAPAARAVVAPSTPLCCSSAKGADKCGTCWKASALTTGYCASEATCAGCGGTWCPNGATFAEAFEEQEQGPLGEAAPGQLPATSAGLSRPAAGLALALACAAVAALVALRAAGRAGRSGRAELEALCTEVPPEVTA